MKWKLHRTNSNQN